MQRNNLCKTYTVDDVIVKLGLCPKENTRKEMEKKVANGVSQYQQGSARPKKIMSTKTHSIFSANLYHPNEVDLVSSIIKSSYPAKTVQKVTPTPRYAIPDGSFASFFHSDSVGGSLFYFIRSYLSVWDLKNLIQSGVPGGTEKSDLFTIGDVLSTRDDTILSRVDRIRIGKEASRIILTYKGGSSKNYTRPHRVVDGLGDRWRWENLFHPAERVQVEEFVDWCLQTLRNANTVANMPPARERSEQTASKLFGSATFGRMDVTLNVALLIRGNKNVLHLARPTFAPGEVLQSMTLRWWFVRYFGDPNPGQAKYLKIRYCQPGSGFYWEKNFGENIEVTLRFENTQEFDALVAPFISDAAVAEGVAQGALFDDRDDNDSDHGSLEDHFLNQFHI